MLFDDNAKMKFKEQSQMVIQNLNSHQWFGNMVTCVWWDYLWLNDGFARYYQYFAMEMVSLGVMVFGTLCVYGLYLLNHISGESGLAIRRTIHRRAASDCHGVRPDSETPNNRVLKNI